ncbi:MAG: energy transducer TonB [Thermoanaerobaculia bacterium]
MTDQRVPSPAGLLVPLVLALLVAILVSAPTAAFLGGALCAKKAIHKVEGDVQAPVRVSSTRPAYPEEARKERIQGTVVLRTVIDERGRVTSAEVVEEKSIDREDLRQTAIEAVEQWTFEPAILEGEPVAVYYHLTINFRLTKDGEKPDKGT